MEKTRESKRRVRRNEAEHAGADADADGGYGDLPMGELPLPHEPALLVEVFLRLPVKSIGRLRCVCKPWLSLLSSSSFIHAHLNRLSAEGRPALILPSEGFEWMVSSPLPQIQTRIQIQSSTLQSLFKRPDQYTLLTTGFSSMIRQDGRLNLISSCDGLLFLQLPRRHRGGQDSLFLLNPITRESRLLPHLSGDAKRSFAASSYGIGYDRSVDDYKVVRIGRTDKDASQLLEVLSLKDTCWRTVQRFDHGLDAHCPNAGVLVSGALNWVFPGRTRSFSWSFMSFDLATEKFVKLPANETLENSDRGLVLCELRGCLCIYCCNENRDGGDLWMMKDYGVQSSLILLASLTFPIPYPCLKCPQPLCFLNKDVIMFYYLGTAFLYNVGNETYSYHKLSDWDWMDAYIHMETLVSPHGNDKIVRG